MLNATRTFTRLPVGTWAVAVLHDENGVGKMNKNLSGVPSEGYAVSNNVTRPFSAPRWSESTFELVAGATMVVPITLHC